MLGDLGGDVVGHHPLQPRLRLGCGKAAGMAQRIDMAGIGHRHVGAGMVAPPERPGIEHALLQQLPALVLHHGL